MKTVVYILNILFFTLFLSSTNAQRVTDNLVVLYDFSEGSGTTVYDRSNFGTPLNLSLNNINSVVWKSPGLQITGEMNLKSSSTATKIVNACKTSNEVTFETWILPSDTVQRSIVARIMTMTKNDIHTNNIKLWQQANDFGFHCRTSTSSLNGEEWKFFNFDAKLMHVVFTHSQDGTIKLYVDDQIVIQDTATGDFSTWDATYSLFLGSDYGTGKYWLGTFYLTAIYSKALSESEISQNYYDGMKAFDFANVQITDISLNLLGDANNSGKYGGHGIMFGDADGDNDPDLYITMNNSSPMADQYFENNGSGVFTEKAAERGIDNYDLKGSHGWVWADLDNDGDYDGWNGSYSKNIPYRNKNDQPGFFDNMFTTSGIDDIELGTRGVAAFDFDNDGDLDLFGNNWYARSTFEDNEFYRNDGNFTFTRIDNGLTKAKGDQGVCDGDFDNDGDIDLLLSVFEGNVDGRCVKLMENVDGQFIENLNTGIDLCNASFHGVTFWDMNNDGWLDVVSANRIFINNKDKTFSEVTGLPALSSTSFMLGIADLNNDGYWDLVPPGLSPVYINNGDLTFTPISYNTGTINDPRCVSFADIDGDGDIDFALGQKATYNRLYRNDYDGLNKSLFVKLKSADNQIGAFGSKVFIYSENGDTLLNFREAHSNQGYLSQDDPTLHFGCGNRNMVLIKIVFLNGQTIQLLTETYKTIIVEDFYPDNTAPEPPILLSAVTSGNNIKLEWNNNSANDLLNYSIYRSLDSNVTFDNLLSFTSDTTYIDTLVSYGINYYYAITAKDTNSNVSELSNIKSAKIIDNIPPNTPLNFTLKLVDKTIVLNWNNNVEPDLDFYAIYKSTDPNFNPDTMSTFTYSTSDTFLVDFDIQNGHYYYIISAFDIHENESNYSDIKDIIITSISKENVLPTSYTLYQNYPNPFNPSTNINFDIVENTNVSLIIFNVLGEEVKNVINQKLNAGAYSINVNFENIESGIYFYRISTNNFTETKKMIFIK